MGLLVNLPATGALRLHIGGAAVNGSRASLNRHVCSIERASDVSSGVFVLCVRLNEAVESGEHVQANLLFEVLTFIYTFRSQQNCEHIFKFVDRLPLIHAPHPFGSMTGIRLFCAAIWPLLVSLQPGMNFACPGAAGSGPR